MAAAVEAPNKPRDERRSYVRGWWGYYRLAEAGAPQANWKMGPQAYPEMLLVMMARRAETLRRSRQLGIKGRGPGVAASSRGAWGIAAQPDLPQALSNRVLRRYGFLVPIRLDGGLRPP